MRQEPEAESVEPESAVELDGADQSGEAEGRADARADHDSEEDLPELMKLPDVLEEACVNARVLVKVCDLLGLGQPSVEQIPELIRGVWLDHHRSGRPDEYFWEHGGWTE